MPAAGVGARAATAQPKQYQLINGRPMLHHAVSALLSSQHIDEVRVAVSASDTYVSHVLKDLPRTTWQPCGGATRAHTVANAIANAKQNGGLLDTDWVLVHDAARPGLCKHALERLISACKESGTGGLLALPVADTVKQACNGTEQGTKNIAQVHTSVDRNGLWLAQTPQMFNVAVLQEALTACLAEGVNITDESSAVEHYGYKPLLITGSMRNFKVTWPEDFNLAARFLE